MSSKNLSQKRPRTAVSEYLKHEIYEYSQNNPNTRQIDIADHFNSQDPNLNLDQTTISKILNDKSKWLAVTEDQLSSIVFRCKKVKYPLLDQSMRLWVEQITNSEVILTELMIKEKAASFAIDNASSHFHNQPSTHETYELNESNSDLDEKTSNNSELESANNSHDNHSKHGKHSTGRSKGHYGSGYGQPRIIPDYSNIELTNIKLEFLPPNTTAHLQPMDAVQ
ncbi:3756_t:CDS:2 [Scutellospora calospora]|uniref:3756_t:CDS:1 n=1 Tax=Scutellospora calospora TaxID=85575 RepID=A0ACA9K3B7_9GLOM|nr:3756_t:CDS:2 [Scutellospora calospora]